MATNEEILQPKVLVLPVFDASNCATGGAVGTIGISGGKIVFATTAGVFETVTSG